MRILVISDIHCNHHKLRDLLNSVKEYDLIIVCGDFDCPQAVDILASKRTLAVSGNMDYFSIIAKLQESGISIENDVKRVGDYVFMGIGREEVSIEEKELEEKLIIVSHYPPYGTKVDIAFTGEHIGSYTVRNVIEKLKPIACLCGHVHEARGVDQIDKTLILNPGPLSWGYYAILDLPSCKYSLRRI